MKKAFILIFICLFLVSCGKESKIDTNAKVKKEKTETSAIFVRKENAATNYITLTHIGDDITAYDSVSYVDLSEADAETVNEIEEVIKENENYYNSIDGCIYETVLQDNILKEKTTIDTSIEGVVDELRTKGLISFNINDNYRPSFKASVKGLEDNGYIQTDEVKEP